MYESYIDKYAELKSRMFPSALAAMNAVDTAEMIAWRFRTAGGRKLSFTERAIAEVFRHSVGLPREVCRICDMALLAAFNRKSEKIDGPQIARVTEELGLTEHKSLEVQNGR